MESKEILAVILAALITILIIGVLSMIKGRADASQNDSVPARTTVAEPDSVYMETDIWDYIREQNATTVTTAETAEEGLDETTESGEETGTLPEGSDITLDPFDSDISTEPGIETETETTTVTEMTEETVNNQPNTYILEIS